MAVIHITRDNFVQEVLQSDIPVLIDFFAVWCGPCKMLAPIIEQLAEEVPGKKICKIDVDAEPELAAQFGVTSIPTLVLIKNGAIAGTIVGMRSKKALLEFLDS